MKKIVERATVKPITTYEIRPVQRAARCGWKNPMTGTICHAPATVAITKRANGERAICYCASCADYIINPRPRYGYSDKNRTWIGKEGDGEDYSFSEELELHGPAGDEETAAWCGTSFVGADPFGMSELVSRWYLPTSDSTVAIEMKSPVYRGLRSFVRDIRSIGQMLKDGHLSVDDRCGTHLHVGHPMRVAACMDKYRAYSFRLTSPLANMLRDDPETAARFFGRPLGGWAEYPVWDSREHCNYINLQHADTIEFRIPRFRSATQYAAVAAFCKDAVSALYENFGKYNILDDKLREHKADVAGNKLCQLYVKYVNAMNACPSWDE